MTHLAEDLDRMAHDAADAYLDHIIAMKRDLFMIRKVILEWNTKDNDSLSSFTADQAAETFSVIEEAFDELFHANWKKTRDISGTIAWPTHIPSFIDMEKRK